MEIAVAISLFIALLVSLALAILALAGRPVGLRESRSSASDEAVNWAILSLMILSVLAGLLLSGFDIDSPRFLMPFSFGVLLSGVGRHLLLRRLSTGDDESDASDE